MGDGTIEDLVILRHYFVAKRVKKELERKMKAEEAKKDAPRKEGTGNKDQVIDLSED